MGKLLSKIFGNKEMRILMLGLDAAGKTSILFKKHTHETIEQFHVLTYRYLFGKKISIELFFHNSFFLIYEVIIFFSFHLIIYRIKFQLLSLPYIFLTEIQNFIYLFCLVNNVL